MEIKGGNLSVERVTEPSPIQGQNITYYVVAYNNDDTSTICLTEEEAKALLMFLSVALKVRL